VLHVVQTGDTLLGIALHYGVSMNSIQNANDIPDPESIKAGQQLVIPIGPTATVTAGPTPTATGLPKYPAPQPLWPTNGQVFEGDEEPILLQWASVGILRDNERYLLQFEQEDAAQPPNQVLTQATGGRIPVELFPKAGDTRRTFRWRVQVVRITGYQTDNTPILTPAGPASTPRTFLWLTAQPTPTPTPGPNS
jgi:murein DD-endopeptidase MepM/ murein hydrolase activator NlpD